MRLSKKDAERLGVLQKDAAPRAPKAAVQHKPGSMAWAEARGWQFVTGPTGVAAWNIRLRPGVCLATARYPAGEGERMDQHYRLVLDAIRAEYP